MPADLVAILLLAPIGFLGSFVYGVAGFGSGLITVPFSSHFLPLPFVLAVFALSDVVNAGRVAFADPGAVVRAEALRLLPSSVAGVAIGAGLLVLLPAWVLMLALGVFLVAYVGYGVLARGALPVVSMRWAWLAGVTGGIASAMFGAGGPPYAVYLSMRPYGKEALRATLAATSFVSVIARVTAFAVAGLLSSREVWIAAAGVLPATLLALWLAGRVHARISREAVVAVIRVLLAVAGGSLVWRAVGMIA